MVLHNIYVTFLCCEEKVYDLYWKCCLFLLADLEQFVEHITGFSHQLGDCVIHGIATSQTTAETESGQALAQVCRTAGESGLGVLAAIEKGILVLVFYVSILFVSFL